MCSREQTAAKRLIIVSLRRLEGMIVKGKEDVSDQRTKEQPEDESVKRGQCEFTKDLRGAALSAKRDQVFCFMLLAPEEEEFWMDHCACRSKFGPQWYELTYTCALLSDQKVDFCKRREVALSVIKKTARLPVDDVNACERRFLVLRLAFASSWNTGV